MLFFLLADSDCSGRSLATLVVAWVGAALVASVLLRWTYMWVALAILTLLFLIACAYAACDARRVHIRALAREEERQLERRRRAREVETISAGIDNYPEILDPPEYQNFWVEDLPPSYTAVIYNQPNSTAPPCLDEEVPPPTGPRLSNPPPYSVAIQSEQFTLSTQNGQQTSGQQSEPVVGQTSSQGGQPSSRAGQPYSSLPRRTAPSPPIRDEDKAEELPQNSHNSQNTTVLSTGTHYLTSILTSTFGRGTRRTNVEQNNLQTYEADSTVSSQNNRNNVNNNSSASTDRNNNSDAPNPD